MLIDRAVSKGLDYGAYMVADFWLGDRGWGLEGRAWGRGLEGLSPFQFLPSVSASCLPCPEQLSSARLLCHATLPWSR